MRKIRIIRGFFVVSVIVLSACGCSSKNMSDSKDGHAVNTSIDYKEKEETEKTYTLKIEGDEGKGEGVEEGGVPEVRLNEKDKTFSFSYDTLSSYLPYGEYSEGEYTDKVYLKTSDGKYEYVFDKIDDNTLKFDKEHSSSLDIIDENITPRLEDGAEFIHE